MPEMRNDLCVEIRKNKVETMTTILTILLAIAQLFFVWRISVEVRRIAEEPGKEATLKEAMTTIVKELQK
jgi:hypothetical protein